MIKYLLIFALFILNNSVFARELINFDNFLITLGCLESNNNDFAVGDKGKSISRYQIQRECYLDAREYDKSIQFSYESLTNKINADQIVKAYILRYSNNNSFEEWARLWNAGPKWRNKKKLTNNYWNKFKEIQNKLSLTSTNK
jgi:hypothetical protein